MPAPTKNQQPILKKTEPVAEPIKTIEKSVTLPKPQSKPMKKIEPQIKKTQTTEKPVKKNTQKNLEESLLSDELNTATSSNAKPEKPVHNNQKQQEKLIADQLQAEQKMEQMAANNNSENKSEIDRYKTLILQQIQQNWIMPQQIDNLFCILEIRLAPGGVVLGVKLIKSSGNEALDHSAIAAVNKATPLPVPTDPQIFNAFRKFTLTVKPEESN